MPVKQEKFAIVQDDLQKIIDVDGGGDGRSVPVNMNFIDEGYLTKDTGFTLFGASTGEKTHSLFHYKKKDGTSYIIRAKGTKLQLYNTFDREWSDITGSPTFTENAQFGYIVYENLLYIGNAVESMYTWNGITFTEYASAPKGNIFEVFEDRVFVTGVILEPLSVYYSNVAVGTAFTATDVVKPLGTDSVTNLKNFYGSLMMFKRDSIWKLTFVYDQVATLFVPKLDQQSGNYGACSRTAVAWVENDLWFFTGREVRSIGYQDNNTGVFGINRSVISESIKETLKLIDTDNYSKCLVAYNNRRFYLGVPITDDENDTTFVCHLLYNRAWTKYTDRDKARINSFMVVDDVIYTSSSSSPYGVIDWQVDTEDTEDINNTLTTE